MVYYNENDPSAAAWLKELIKQGLIAKGDVDERSIEDVAPNDLHGYRQHHFFAGIGVWSYALRLAGWPDDRPVWTGSCPCQPFSGAGKRKGFMDERHLWPAWFWLIEQYRPDTIFGEQVAKRDGETWLDLVQADLEAKGYICGAVAMAACGVGAPHQRKRLYWVANSSSQDQGRWGVQRSRESDSESLRPPRKRPSGFCAIGSVADDCRSGRKEQRRKTRKQQSPCDTGSASGCTTSSVADREGNGRSEECENFGGGAFGNSKEGGTAGFGVGGVNGQRPDGSVDGVANAGCPSDESRGGVGNLGCPPSEEQGKTQEREWGGQTSGDCGPGSDNPGPVNGFWAGADWLGCRDGKFRPVRSGSFPLVNGTSARVGRLRGYGNAIVAQQAKEFIEAFMSHPRKQLYPVQQTAVDSLLLSLSKHRACLNSSDTGTGKTLMSVEKVRASGLKTLVVCPKAVVPSWEECFREQGVPFLGVVGWEKVRTGRTQWGAWKSKAKDSFGWNEEIELIVFDEIHKAKSPSSLNAVMVMSAKGRYVIGCSATASENPTEMKALGYILGLHGWWNFPTWCLAHGCAYGDMNKLEFVDGLREYFLPKLHAAIYPERGYRVTRQDMGEFFSRTSIITEPLEFGDAGGIEKIYAEMAKELAALRETRSMDATGAEGLTAQLRARQEVELLKVPLFTQFTNDYLEEGRSAVVFFQFKESIKRFRANFSFPVPAIEGGQSAKARQEILEGFSRDEYRVIACNLEAGGLGVNLHDIRGEFPRAALISPNWNVKTLLQVLGRVDRAGALTDTIQRIFFAPGTIEDEVRVALENKLQNLNSLHRMSDEETTTLMDFQPSEIWARAQGVLLTKGLEFVQNWKVTNVKKKGRELVLEGPDHELTRGERMSITNALRKASKMKLTWDFQPLKSDQEPSHFEASRQIGETTMMTAVKEAGIHVHGEVPAPASPEPVRMNGESVDLNPSEVPEEWRALREPSGGERGKAILAPGEYETAHAKFNPSSWEYWERCPSYQNRDDEDQDTTFAEEGTRYHKIVETEDDSHGESDEEKHHARQTIQLREQLLLKHGLLPENREDHRELRLSIKLHDESTFGTVDHAAIAKFPFADGTKLAVLMDYKYGRTPVTDAEVNAQILAYALGVFQMFPDVGTIVSYILLPRQNQVSQGVYSRVVDYGNMMLRAETIARRRRERAGEEFHPAPSLCEWCGNLATCAAVARTSLLIAQKYDPEEGFFDVPELVHGTQLNDPLVVAKLRHITPILRKWADGIDRRASQMVFEEGFELPGVKAVYKKYNRNISSPLAAYNLLVNPEVLGLDFEPILTHDEYLACVSKVGITELLSIVSAKTPEGKKRTEYQEFVEGFLRDNGALTGGGDETYGTLVLDRKHHKK